HVLAGAVALLPISGEQLVADDFQPFRHALEGLLDVPWGDVLDGMEDEGLLVRHSTRMQPRANKSARPSSGWRLTCSGERYIGFPLKPLHDERVFSRQSASCMASPKSIN